MTSDPVFITLENALREALGARLHAVTTTARVLPGFAKPAPPTILIAVENAADYQTVWRVVQPQAADLPALPLIVPAELVSLWQAQQQQPGQLLTQLFTASGALFAGEGEEAAQSAAALAELAGLYGIAADLPSAAQFARLHQQMMGELSADVKHTPQPDAPAVLPSLVALYDELTIAVLVVTNESAETFGEIDWGAVQAAYAEQFDGFLVATVAQFQQLAEGALALDFATQRYRYQWGENLLADYAVTPVSLVRCARDNVLAVLVQHASQQMLSADEAGLRKVAHDLLNDMLRISLRNDILSFSIAELMTVPQPPVREEAYTTQHERLERILRNLHQWVTYYESVLVLLETA